MGILLPMPSIRSIGSHSHGHSVINFYYLAFTVNCEIYKESNDITGKDKNRWQDQRKKKNWPVPI